MAFAWLALNWDPCPEGERPSRFGFQCPRTQRMCSGLLIAGTVVNGVTLQTGKGNKPACWDWNGDRVKPTFRPSINCLAHNPKNPAEKYAGCGAHGHITDGVWKDAK